MSSNIDHIFYINLDYRTDRKQQFENDMKNLGLIDKVERFSAFKTDYGATGCGLSHIAVLKLAKERGYKNVLICEDDFQVLVDKETFEKELERFFSEVKNFDVCMFSYSMRKHSEVPGKDYLYKVLEANTTSGYLINSHYYDVLLNLYEETVPLLESTRNCFKYAVDQTWKKFQLTDVWYAFKNRLGKQRCSYSDITHLYEDYNI